MGEPSIDSLHDVYEEQLGAARYKAERDQLRQRADALEEWSDEVEDMYRDVFHKWMDEAKKAKRLGKLVWRLQNRLARSHRREKALRKGMREWREKAIDKPQVTMSAYDLLPEEDREALRWVRDHGGLNSVKKLLDWVVGHCSTRQQLDFDFWLSGRVMHELGFEEDMADRDEVERRLLARLMPEGYEWPTVDGKPVDFVTGYVPSLGVLEAVSIYSNGACEVMSHDGIVKSVKEIHIDAPKVLDADGVEIREGDTVYLLPGKWCGEYPLLYYNGGDEMVVKELDPGHELAGVLECAGDGKCTCFPLPRQLTHTKPEIDTWERIEEDAEKDPCGYFGFDGEEICGKCPASGKNCEQTMAQDLVRRAKALAERDAS